MPRATSKLLLRAADYIAAAASRAAVQVAQHELFELGQTHAGALRDADRGSARRRA